jgi:DNA-directed RNA polymerase subunit RPC12/RpoP
VSGYDAWLHAQGPRHYRELTCGECGYFWEELGHVEYGIWLPERDDDLECPECEGEAE